MPVRVLGSSNGPYLQHQKTGCKKEPASGKSLPPKAVRAKESQAANANAIPSMPTSTSTSTSTPVLVPVPVPVLVLVLGLGADVGFQCSAAGFNARDKNNFRVLPSFFP